jgi:lipoprotein NlpD
MTHSNTLSLRLLTSVKAMLAISSFALIAACGSLAPGGSAPVEDRGTMQRPSAAAGSSATTPNASAPSATPAITTNGTSTAAKPLLGQENAGKPGYYTIRPGDTLIRIGLDAGQSWRDIARWNGLDNPNIIEVGQVVRIIPPGTVAVAAAPLPASNAPPSAQSAQPAPAGEGVVTRPVTAPSAVTATSLPAAGTRTAAAQPATPSVTPAPVPAATGPLPPASSPSDEDVQWIWPVALGAGGSGNVIATFDDVKNKGVGISGKLGDAILAAGDGRVVYAGAGLRGYGNLVILKHNNTYLTAYAHNQTLLVKEDQTVRKGQKIAEMGNSDSDRTKLHFEIRRQGKPVDPLRFLPAR